MTTHYRLHFTRCSENG